MKSNSKNAKGSGTIRKRSDGRWEARYTTGIDPKTGKQIQKSVYGKTQKEVRQKLTEVTAEIDSGTYLEQTKDTVGEWLETTLNNINVFNAGKKREEAVALLAQLLPEVESFQAETQRLRDTIAHERRNASFQREINADLRNELKAERSHSFDQSMKLSELERRYKRAERLLSKIPQEELDRFLPKQKGLER